MRATAHPTARLFPLAGLVPGLNAEPLPDYPTVKDPLIEAVFLRVAPFESHSQRYPLSPSVLRAQLLSS